MSEDPTDEEIKGLLSELRCIMVAHSKTKAPLAFDFVWPNKLHEVASMLDYYNKDVYVLIQTGDDQFTWSKV